MDRGHLGDDPDDVEAAPDRDTMDPTADADGPAEAAPSTEAVAEVASAQPADERPAAWLAEVRARAPWLLEPGGALHSPVTGMQGPDRVPHGVAPPHLAVSGSESAAGRSVSRPGQIVGPRTSPGAGDRPPIDRSGAGDAGPDTSAGRPGGPTWPSAIGPLAERLEVEAWPAGNPRTTHEARHDAVPATNAPGPADPATASKPLWPALETPHPGPIPEPASPDAPATREPEPTAPAPDFWPGLDARRPSIHRPSATWPPPSAHTVPPPPVWPPRPRPDGVGLPHPGPTPEPSRTLHRPVTPFVPDRPGPASPTSGPARPTWAEDHGGWHPTAVPVGRIVDETALPSWPSLLDDDDEDGEEPDWSALERGFDRMVRLDREQRRR